MRLAETGDYDAIVVDTPPIGGGTDFFTAPHQVRDLVAGKALRLLTGPSLPGRRMVYSPSTRAALRLADRILGGRLLADLGDFLVDLRTTYDGIRSRAGHVQPVLDEAAVVAVTTPYQGPLQAAASLLAERRVLGAIANRALPPAWASADPGPPGPLHDNMRLWSAEARRQSTALETLETSIPTIRVRPHSPAPTSVTALTALARHHGLAAIWDSAIS